MKKTTLFCFLMLLLCLQQVKAQTYRVGDVIQNDDGSIGVVFYVNFDKTGGWMVALEDVSTGCPWGTANNIPNLTDYNPGDFFYQILLTDLDGLANTQTIRAYQNNNANYAAGKMDINHGWYLPSCGQLEYLYTALPFIEASITALGGATLVEDCYWSSTERTAENAWVVRFGSNNNIGGCIYSFPKTENYPVRAIRDFTMAPPSTGNVTYLWNTGATTQDITVSPSQTSTYSVVVTIDDGNEASAQKTITVNHADTVNYYISSCGNYTWHDQTYSTSGQYAHETTNEDGCYRLELLHLTISEGYREEYHEEECERYLWPVNHQWYYQSVLDSIVVEGQQGACDSTFVLDLTINHGYHEEYNVTSCEPYEWHGTLYAESGTYPIEVEGPNGCDSVLVLNLQLSGNLSSAIIGRTTIYPSTDIFSGVYPYYVDSTSINPTAVHWSIDRDDWYVLPHGASCELVCTSAGWGELRAWTEGESCNLDTTLFINAQFFGLDEESEESIKIYPNPTQGTITIDGDNLREVKVHNVFGQEIFRNVCNNNSHVINMERCCPGLYFIEIVTPSRRFYKLVVLTN